MKAKQPEPTPLRDLIRWDRKIFSEKWFLNKFSLAPCSVTTCLGRLTAEHRRDIASCPYCFNKPLSSIDHPRMFRFLHEPSRRPSVFVWFPYPGATAWDGDKSYSEALAWTTKRHLNLLVLNPNTGWYGHGTRMIVVWTKPYTERIKLEVKDILAWMKKHRREYDSLIYDEQTERLKRLLKL